MNASAPRAPQQPGADAAPLALFGWAMFDWANQPFFTIITTFIDRKSVV